MKKTCSSLIGQNLIACSSLIGQNLIACSSLIGQNLIACSSLIGQNLIACSLVPRPLGRPIGAGKVTASLGLDLWVVQANELAI